MKIDNSEWKEFAEFIANQSTHMCSQYWEDGTYTCCPFSTVERAYAAFSVWRCCHSSSEVRKFYDVNFVEYSPDYDPMEEYYHDLEEPYDTDAWKQAEIDECYEQQYPEFEWPDEADNYRANREKQITRIAHELADRHPYLSLFGKFSWMSLVYPFYKEYELNSDERTMFVQEYYAQQYLNHHN